MDELELMYRGTLKSCNYSCYYCPFSKNTVSLSEIEKDKFQLKVFFEDLNKKYLKKIFITPYGEGLIHKYYRDEIEKAVKREDIKSIGIQTNLSLNIIEWIKNMKEKKLPIDKINLWVTCHFSQIDYDTFIFKIKNIYKDINISVGVVGIPKDYEDILSLRKDLPKSVYLWINEYSHLKEEYSKELIEKFKNIDPIFYRRKEIDFSEYCSCGVGSFFIEGNGKVRLCNRNPKILGTFMKENYFSKKHCNKKDCDCYLTYSKFKSNIFNFFGDKKLYRVPEKINIKNIFFDIDGTLVENREISQEKIETIKFLYEKNYNLYFITDLPKDIALKKCSKVNKYFKGGIFDCGAHISMENLEIYETMEINMEMFRENILKSYSFDNKLYKVLLKRNNLKIEGTDIFKGIPNILVKKGINKFSALKKVGSILNMNLDEVLAVGNDLNDVTLFINLKYSVCVLNGKTKAKEKSKYQLNINQILYILRGEKI